MMIYTGRSKPLVGTKTDRRNPLARELKVYYPLNEGIGLLVNNVADSGRYNGLLIGSTAGVPQWSANGEGPVLRWPPGGNWGWVQSMDTVGLVGNHIFSYAVFFTYEQNVNNPSLLTECLAANNNPQIQLNLVTQLAVFLRDDAAHQVAPAAVGPNLLDNQIHMAAAVSDGGSLFLYVDGVLMQTTNIATIGQTTTDQLLIGASRAGGNQFRGSVSQVMGWARALATDEVLSLFRYPYQLLRVNA
jgi:hypothetical protein